MKAKSIGVSFGVALFVIFAFNIKTGYPASASAATLEQRKSEHLKRMDERINHLQAERACVQAATTEDGIKNCREQLKKGNGQRKQRS